MGMLAKDLLTKKGQVEFIFNDILVGEAIEKMEQKRYAMIPVLERGSKRYLYSLSEGDLLRFVLGSSSMKKAMKSPLSNVTIERLTVPVREDSEISALIDLAANQTFIPLVDNNGVFKGIVTRRAIINAIRPQLEEGE